MSVLLAVPTKAPTLLAVLLIETFSRLTFLIVAPFVEVIRLWLRLEIVKPLPLNVPE